ncbi:Protein of uncharacterised function (DUF3558) [Nocardia cyriacigeorgica]|uniref:Protein of uncharacterized function (DUF3558) n=1 Tax=Nocardia cyriacigeorgica TaxID=135487 RepID=A0A4U8W7F2_9NOCA|nr:Protein of uncharacterised function (DUF3558) [Nocardia cyriacigeorgica]
MLGFGAGGSVLGNAPLGGPLYGAVAAGVGNEGGYVSVDNRGFRRAGRVRGTVLLAAAVLGVAGCSGSTEGSPTAVESAATSAASGETSGGGSAAASTSAKSEEGALWDPCALPESAISGTGLEPASKESGIANVDFTDADWKTCDWRATAGWYNFGMYSGTPTLDEVRARPDYTSFVPRSVGAREALQFRDTGATAHLTCAMAVAVPQGIVMFDVQARASVGVKDDPCVVLDRHVADLAEYLPAS